MTSHNDETTSVSTGKLLAGQLAALEEPIVRANLPGNIDGLLAHHILRERRVTFGWNVDPMTEQWLQDNEHRLTHPAGMAILGYGLTALPGDASRAARQHLLAGLPGLMRRSPFQTDGVTLVNDPGQIVGLALAVNAVADDNPKPQAWLREVLLDSRLRPPTVLLLVFHEQARHILGVGTAPRLDLRETSDPVDLAGLHWLATSARSFAVNDPTELRQLQAKVLNAIILGQTGPVSAPRAALLIEAAAHIVTTSVDEQLLDRNHVGVLFNRFTDAMHQWRYDTDGAHPIQWPITSEREVQNIIWIMLRPVFNDLVDEETLRKMGHSTYRADFAIPSLCLLIEVKYARKAADFKELEKEIFEDYVAYLTDNGPYRKMAVFIYDESASVQEHGTTRNALLKLPNITDVIIACRPSHIPLPETTRRRRRQVPLRPS